MLVEPDVSPYRAALAPKRFPNAEARSIVEVAPLGVGDCAVYLMPRIMDPRGALSVGEYDRDLPFHPQRYFMVYDVPTEEIRGEHAHRECHQFLVCVHGSCHALVDDGSRRAGVVLDDPAVALYMPPMIWGTQYRYSNDARLLVFASRQYNSADYIREYTAFVNAVGQ